MKSIKQHVLDLLESDVTDANKIARRSCLDPQQDNIHMIVYSENAKLL